MTGQERSNLPAPSPSEFVRSLFGAAFGGSRRAVIWTKGRGPVWCASGDEVTRAVAAHVSSRDVYVGACLQDAGAEAPHSRGRAATASAMGGVWVDIDVETGIHGASGYPPDVDTALNHLAGRVPLPPSVALNTGGGLHLWWFLDEPLEIHDESDRAQAAELVGRFQSRIRQAWDKRGWRLDATHDLARVMRLPGTQNHKHKPPQDVLCLVWEPARVYTAEVLLEGAPEWAPPTREAGEVDGDLVIIPSAEPPASKLTLLMEIDPTFKRTWLRKRSDLADQSQSGYDMALMSRALKAGWTDQEVIDLAIAHRRSGGRPPKRASYYLGTAQSEGTLGRLKASIASKSRAADRDEREGLARQGQQEATERLLEASVGLAAPTPGQEPKVPAERVLADLRASLGLPVVGVRKHVTEPPWWEMLLDGPVDCVPLGGIEWALQYSRFRARVAEATDLLPAPMKNEQWAPIAQLMLRIAERVEYADLTQGNGLAESLVRDYIASFPPSREPKMVAPRGHPLIVDDCLRITLSGFRQWLAFAERESMSRAEAARLLRRAGWTTSAVTYDEPGPSGTERRTSRSYYRAPRRWPYPHVSGPSATHSPI